MGRVLLGADAPSVQQGLLGRSGGREIALDLRGCHTLSLFGVQGFGKSYTLGSIVEMATTPIPGINVLPAPLGALVFHYHRSDAYAPELVAAVDPNDVASEIELLWTLYGARPRGLADVLVLTPAGKVAGRRRDLPHVQVEPIRFGPAEVGAEGWRMLLGATGTDALYIRQLVAILRRHRASLTLEHLREGLAEAELSPMARRLADDRLALASEYLDDAADLSAVFRPGRTVIVDLRDEWIEKEEALCLFVVMMRIFARSRPGGRPMNKLVVFDEAHKYLADSDVMGEVVETIREMRHQGTSVIVASQDPLSVPRAIVELSSSVILHRMTSPQWMRHLKGALAPLERLDERAVAILAPGQAIVWSQRSTDAAFLASLPTVDMRPRVTRHGGATATATT